MCGQTSVPSGGQYYISQIFINEKHEFRKTPHISLDVYVCVCELWIIIDIFYRNIQMICAHKTYHISKH